jgi:hypothetical protein
MPCWIPSASQPAPQQDSGEIALFIRHVQSDRVFEQARFLHKLGVNDYVRQGNPSFSQRLTVPFATPSARAASVTS